MAHSLRVRVRGRERISDEKSENRKTYLSTVAAIELGDQSIFFLCCLWSPKAPQANSKSMDTCFGQTRKIDWRTGFILPSTCSKRSFFSGFVLIQRNDCTTISFRGTPLQLKLVNHRPTPQGWMEPDGEIHTLAIVRDRG